MLSNTQKVQEKPIHVNTLCENIHHQRSDLLNSVLCETVLCHQKQWFDYDLGPRYQRDRICASFSCPDCLGQIFIRKGTRYRLYKSVLGKSLIPVLQVQCRSCGRRFCPYKQMIGLAFDDRISPALKQRQLELTCQFSYRKARDFINSCLDIRTSTITIRKEIDRKADQIRKRPVSANGEIVYDDSTKVKAGPKERGTSIHLAITARPGKSNGKRNTMIKRLMFLKTGSEYQIKESLKDLHAKGIVHDGYMDLSGCAPLLQRCLWHLVHQLKHYLWMDNVTLKDREPYIKELIEILFHSSSMRQMRINYRSFFEKLFSNGLIQSYVHLSNAENELTTSRANHFPYHTTSPVEREMREINRRSDIGVRWSIPGIENLLLVKTDLALNGP